MSERHPISLPPEWDPLTLDIDKLTPMMQHYVELKRQYPQALLLYRLGDFYETFFHDAYTVAHELELVLTGREGGSLGRIPMAGVPHHALERYAAQLVTKGYAIAICEQMEPADQAKGLVRREVTRILTPGTVLEEGLLPPRQNNYLASIVLTPGQGKQIHSLTWGLAYADVSTGEFWVTQSFSQDSLTQELWRLQPAEVLIPVEDPLSLGMLRPGVQSAQLPDGLPSQFCYTFRPQRPFTLVAARQELMQRFRVRSLEGFGCADLPLAIGAAGGLLHYLSDTQKDITLPLQSPRTYTLSEFLLLDYQTRRNLELTQTVRDGSLLGSLLWALDRTRTAMGGRALRRWLLQPLLHLHRIRERQDCVAEFVADSALRTQVQAVLSDVYDLERLASRVGAGTANARDLVGLGHSLGKLPALSRLLESSHTPLLQPLQQIDPRLEQLSHRIQSTLVSSPPLILTEGGLIQSGVESRVDDLRQQIETDRQWIANLEKTEKERTGIHTLKVGYTKAFGYYISISRAKAGQVPSNYIRKQTLVNEERFITPDLKEREARILNTQMDLHQLEYEVFLHLRTEVGVEAAGIREMAQTVAAVDVLAGLAEVAAYYHYCRPTLVEDRRLQIVEGRHPVVEQSLPSGLFVPNSVMLGFPPLEPLKTGLAKPASAIPGQGCEQPLDGAKDLSRTPTDPDLIVLTGANMTGKSTFLRQTGLIQIMAQMGSFVPADSALLGLCDRIFTRVGAVDDLATGQSTFMVEMNETANILNHATPSSLVLLDEIGRGTATFDGLAIAWSVAEYLAGSLRARTIFATHYHELNELATLVPNVANFQVTVKELAAEIVFLHKVQPGGASRSYGIEVGRMAGLPTIVIQRARQVLDQIEKHSHIAMGLRNQGQDNQVQDHQVQDQRGPVEKASRSRSHTDQLTLFGGTPS